MGKISLILFLLLSNLLLPAPAAPTAPACTLARDSVCPRAVDGRLQWLRTRQARGELTGGLAAAVPVTVRFDHTLDDKELAALAAAGWAPAGQLANIVPLTVPWGQFDSLLARTDIVQVDADTTEDLTPPLDISVPDIHGTAAWVVSHTLPSGLSGAGVTVADIDTGVDVFHPLLFRADGGTFTWLDVNHSGSFEPGQDAVDLNGNGTAEPNETLRFVDATSLQFDGFPRPYDVPGTNDGVYRTDMDWLYNDNNGNNQRDYGPGSDNLPGMGERVFLVADNNGNHLLDPGETLLGLGASRIAKVFDNGGVTRRRGIDLSQTAPDDMNHGTAVLSIVAGGWRGFSRYTSVAPDADLLLADPYGSGNSLSQSLIWSLDNGADVVIHEYTHIAGEYFDGSSNQEAMISAAHQQGVVQVLPAGNLNRGRKHAHLTLAPGAGATLPLSQPTGVDAATADVTLVWQGDSNLLAAALTTPTGGAGNRYVVPAGATTTTTADGHTVASGRFFSSRGTGRVDIHLLRTPLASGTWTLAVTNTHTSPLTLTAFVQDNRTAFVGGFEWGAFRNPASSVVWPATADAGIVVGSYSTRGFSAGLDPVTVGGLSAFSGQGPRVDGQALMDVTAPSNYDIVAALDRTVTGAWGQYRWFSGTSGAAPHIGGAVALLRQARPDLNAIEIEAALRAGARRDSFTGLNTNEQWGAGKLDLAGALRQTLPFAPLRAVRLSGPSPVLDGVMQPNEWQGARHVQIPLAFLTDQPRQGTLDVWLAATPGAGNQLWAAAQVRGIAPVAGDALQLWFSGGDVKSLGVGSGWRDWRWNGSTLVLDGQQDGQGVASVQGGVITYELRMPLVSGDSNDVALSTVQDSGFAVTYGQPFVDGLGTPRRAVGAWPADFFDGRLARLGRLAVAAAITGDLNGDGVSDVVDVQLVAARWLSDSRTPGYSAVFDLNADGMIDLLDVQLAADTW